MMGSWLVNVLEKFGKKKKKNTLLVTIFFTTKNIFILNIYVMYVFLNIHIDDYHFSNITKLKKKAQKLHKRCHNRVLALFFHTTTPIPVKEPLRYLYMCVTTLGAGGERGWEIILCSIHNKVIRKVTMSFTGCLTPNQFFHPEFHRVSHNQTN